MKRIIDVITKEQLDELENESALTIEGLSEGSIPDFMGWVDSLGGLKNETAYVIKGAIMNYQYNLTGSNAYPDDLSIVCIKLSDIENVPAIILPRFQIGGRWFDDVVENNRRRQEGN